VSDLLLASEIVVPGAGEALDPDSLVPVDRDLLEASRATPDRERCDIHTLSEWLIDRGRWRPGHKSRLLELCFDVWEGLEPPIQRQIIDDTMQTSNCDKAS